MSYYPDTSHSQTNNTIKHRRQRQTKFQERYFSVDERASIKDVLLTVVNSFYCDITTLICDYIKESLRIGTMLDIFDELTSWRTGYVVYIQENYVGVHYNNYSCDYDDWIDFNSCRLAPFGKHTLTTASIFVKDPYDGGSKLSVDEFEWCQDIYYELLHSSFNFSPMPLWMKVLGNCSQHYKGKHSDSTPIKDQVRSIKDELAVTHQHSRILRQSTDPSKYLLIIKGVWYDKEKLEDQSQKYLGCSGYQDD